MEENIEEAVEILKYIKEYMQENIDNGTHKFIYNEQGFDEKCIDIINAINEILSDYKRVLKENEELKEDNKHQYEEICKLTFELENYIPKQKIKNKIEELEPELKFEITEREAKLQINLLKSLLEGEI